MITRQLLALSFLILLPLAVSAQPGTSFTYQAVLQDGSAPAEGSYDFEFSLWDSSTAGAQIGATVSLSSLSIADGLVEADLDFGVGAFDGEARWLQVAVQSSARGGFTTLTPRREIRPAPQAQYAILADSAVNDAVDDADADAANELQTLEFRAPILSITDGNNVDLSSLVPAVPDGHSLDADDGSPRDALYVDAEGFVGIGTGAPSVGLQIDTASEESTFSLAELDTAIDEAGFPFLFGAWQVVVVGTVAYVISSADNSLTMIDVSDPANLTQLGSAVNNVELTALVRPQDIVVDDNIAYVVSETADSLTMIDVSSPAAPVELGTAINGAGFTALNAPNSVFLDGTTAYVTSRSPNALSIIDVSDPTSPIELGTAVDGVDISNLSGPFDVAVSGDVAYVVVTGGQRLVLIDVSDPANPVELSAAINGQGFSAMASPIQVVVSGTTAYVVAQSGDSLTIIDASDPTNPFELGFIRNGLGATALDQPRGIFLDNNIAYVASQVSDSLTVIDVSDPANPVELGVAINGDGYSALDFASGVYVSGSTAFVASSSSSSLTAIDVSIPRPPIGLQVTNAAFIESELEVSGNLIAGRFIGNGSGLAGIDTDPANEIQDLSSSDSGTERTINISGGGASTTIDVADFDNSVGNELQTLSGIGSAVTLSNGGGTVQVSGLAAIDGDPDNVVAIQTDGDILVDGTTMFVDVSADRIAMGGETTPLAGVLDIQRTGIDAADSAAMDQFHLMIRNEINDNNIEAGIGFKVTTTSSGGPGAAITHERTAGSGVGDLHFKTAQSGGLVVTRMTIDSTGRIFMPDLTSSISGVGLEYVPSTGEVIVATSSEKFKDNIQAVELDAEKILELQPVTYNYKESDEVTLGYIAEQLDALGLKQLVVYDDNGEPYSIAYKLIPLFQNELIKKHEAEIKALRAEKDEEIEALEARLDRLEALLTTE